VRSPGIAKILNLPLAVPASKTRGTEGLVTRENSKVFDLVVASAAAVCAVVADERAVAQQKKVRVRVEKGVASVATEAIEMPAVSSKFEGLALFQNLSASFAREDILRVHWAIQIVVHGDSGGRRVRCRISEQVVGEGLQLLGQAQAANRHAQLEEALLKAWGKAKGRRLDTGREPIARIPPPGLCRKRGSTACRWTRGVGVRGVVRSRSRGRRWLMAGGRWMLDGGRLVCCG